MYARHGVGYTRPPVRGLVRKYLDGQAGHRGQNPRPGRLYDGSSGPTPETSDGGATRPRRPDRRVATLADVASHPTPERGWADRPAAAQATARRWEGMIVTAILAAAATAYAWDLDQQGWANAYYSAAAQAGAHSWRAAFFGSLEVGNAVSTDKPPAALWLMDLSVRAFGLSSWSVVLPQIVESIGTLFVLHRTVRLVPVGVRH